MSADKFQYTCMGGEITIDGVDDKKDMEETQRTFSLLGKNGFSCQTVAHLKCQNFSVNITFFSLFFSGLKEDFQSDVFKVLAAILHLGNVEIKNSGGDKSSVSVSFKFTAHPKI